MTLRVRTGSRLHLGLLRLCDAPFLDRQTQPILPGRRFGGVGLMIDSPNLVVRVDPGDFAVAGVLADRAAAFARQVLDSLRLPPPNVRLTVECAPPEHTGLGAGTQLGLAVARALSLALGRDDSVAQLARLAGRGRRSGLGVHGFAHGGFLVDAGKGSATVLAPLAARAPFPDWPVVLILPREAVGLHGAAEREAFAALAGVSSATTDALCRLVLLGMLPALLERDFAAFGEAVFDFNARSGELFAAIQGGAYATAGVAELIGYLRRQGVTGVGQSSWGPGVFAFTEDDDRAAHLADRVRQRIDGEVVVTRARNEGAGDVPCPVPPPPLE